MQKKNIFLKIINVIEDSFMKNHSCISCYKEIPDETKFMLCDDCEKKIEFLTGELCQKCGDNINKDGTCVNDCKKYRYVFASNISLCYYTESAAKIIKNLKYGKKKYLAKNVADMMLMVADKIKDIDVVMYVPSSKKRIKERGFNQAEELAKIICEKLNKKLLGGLIKIKETIHQAGGSQEDRLKNLRDSFGIDKRFADDICGKNVLIVDDVFTTGSTLNECTKVVKSFKPNKIMTMTFAKTKFNSTLND